MYASCVYERCKSISSEYFLLFPKSFLANSLLIMLAFTRVFAFCVLLLLLNSCRSFNFQANFPSSRTQLPKNGGCSDQGVKFRASPPLRPLFSSQGAPDGVAKRGGVGAVQVTPQPSLNSIITRSLTPNNHPFQYLIRSLMRLSPSASLSAPLLVDPKAATI